MHIKWDFDLNVSFLIFIISFHLGGPPQFIKLVTFIGYQLK